MKNSRAKITGINIKSARLKPDMSQEKLAELVNVSRDTISNIETGKSETYFLTIVDIARVLEVDINEFIKDI